MEPVGEGGLIEGDGVVTEADEGEEEVEEETEGLDDEVEEEGAMLCLDGVECVLVGADVGVEALFEDVVDGHLGSADIRVNLGSMEGWKGF
jgi:hypothetical protein